MQQINITCSICLTSLTDPTCLSCGHTFCLLCIEKYLIINPCCPLCRKPTLPGQVVNEMLRDTLELCQKDPEELKLELPSMIMCLDCGLTPINPVVLPCQHLFCHACAQRDLEEQQCPACLQICMMDNFTVNLLFNEFLQWHCPCEEKIIITESKKFRMPIFLFNKQVMVGSEVQISVVENRYQKLIKYASDGSGQFPICPLTENFPTSADMVLIQNISQNVLSITGSQRIIIHEVYGLNADDEKIQFNAQNFQFYNQQLWLCDYEVILDTSDKSDTWSKISQFLLAGYKELSQELQSLFYKSFSNLNILNSKSNGDSLALIQLLKIPHNDLQSLYYSNDECLRNNYIWNLIQKLRDQILHQLMLVKQNSNLKMHEEVEPIKLPQIAINLAYTSDSSSDDDVIQQIYQDQSIPQQLILNLFRLSRLRA